MNPKGIAIALDAFFALLLLGTVLVFFAGLPFSEPPVSQTASHLDEAMTGIVNSLEKTGFLSSQLVDRVFDQQSVDEIYEKATALLPPSTALRVQVTKFGIPEVLTACIASRAFADCFPSSLREEFAAGDALPTSGFVKEQKVLSRRQPVSDVTDLAGNQCASIVLKPSPKPQVLRLQQQELPVEFDAKVTAVGGTWDSPALTQLSCDQDALMILRARNEAREPVALMLVMDRSGSMIQTDMVFDSESQTVSGGLCQRQVIDMAGQDHNANNFFVDMAPSVPPQPPGNARAGDFNNAYLETPDQSLLQVQNFTFSAWAYRTCPGSCGGSSLFLMQKANDYEVRLSDSGNLQFKLGSSSVITTSAVAGLNSWTHLALTYDSSNVRAYQNGELKSTHARTTTIPNSDSNLLFGVNLPGYYLDEIKIHNVKLSDSQIDNLNDGTEPQVANLILHYDFEELNLNQSVPCFVRAAQTVPGTTTCGLPGNCSTGECPSSNGWISTKYTNVFSPVTTFNPANEKTQMESLPFSGSILRVVMDRASSSGVCSQISGTDWHKPPFVRVRKPGGTSFFGYSTANQTEEPRVNIVNGTHTVELWNANTDAYAPNIPGGNNDIYEDYVTWGWNIANPSGTVSVPALQPSEVNAEAGDKTAIAFQQPVTPVTFEPGTCAPTGAETGWQTIGTFNLTESNIYRLNFYAQYVKVAGSCGPHFRVQLPNLTYTPYTVCPNGTAECMVNAHLGNRTSGPYALFGPPPSGTYTLQMRSDTSLSVDSFYYFEKYYPNAINNSDVLRRCELTGPWTQVGSYTFDTWQKIYVDQVRSNYNYTGAKCLPQMRVITPGDPPSILNELACPYGDTSCAKQVTSVSYAGPAYATTGTYQVFMRSAYPVTVTPLDAHYNYFRTLFRLTPPGSPTVPGVSGFIGDGTCSGGACTFNAGTTVPAQTNCPNTNKPFHAFGKLPLAQNFSPLSNLLIDSNDYYRFVKTWVRGTNTDPSGACNGAAVEFVPEPVAPNFATVSDYMLPAENASAIIRHGIYPSTDSAAWDGDWSYLWNTPPIPIGTYQLNAWSEASTNYDVNWYLERIDHAKISAKVFLDSIPWQAQDSLGLVSFSDTVTTDVPLTPNNPLGSAVTAVKTGVNNLVPAGETYTGDGLDAAISQIRNEPTDNKFMVLLSDGGTTGGASPIAAAADANANGITIFTIGFGTTVNQAELQSIANQTGGLYFYADDANGLTQAFALIAIQIQQQLGSTNVIIPMPDGLVYSNPVCENAAGGPCTGTAQDATCNCQLVSLDLNQALFSNATLGTVAPNWWEAQIPFTVPCDGNLCTDKNLTLPPSGSFGNSRVETVGGGSVVNWPEEDRITIPLLVRDLGVDIVSGFFDPNAAPSPTSYLDVNLANLGNYAIELANRNQLFPGASGACQDLVNCCQNGIAIDFYHTDPNDSSNYIDSICWKGRVPPSPSLEIGLCTQADCPDAPEYPDQNRFFSGVPLEALGYLYARIDPIAAVPTGGATVTRECRLHNTSQIVCLGPTIADYYVIEFWGWKE